MDGQNSRAVQQQRIHHNQRCCSTQQQRPSDVIQALTERQHEIFRLRKVFYGGFETHLSFVRTPLCGRLFAVSELMQALEFVHHNICL